MRIGCSLINLFLIVVCNIRAAPLSHITHNTYSRIFVHCPLSLASSAEHSGICFINSTSQAGYLVLEVEKHATVVQISYDSFFFCQNCGIQTLHRNSLSPFECDGSVTLEHLRTNPSLQCKSLISTRNGDEPASFYSRVHLDSSIFKDVSLDDSYGGLVCGRGLKSETVEKYIFHNISLLIMVVQYPSLPLVLSVTHSLSLIVSSLTAFQKVLAGQSTVGMHPHLL